MVERRVVCFMGRRFCTARRANGMKKARAENTYTTPLCDPFIGHGSRGDMGGRDGLNDVGMPSNVGDIDCVLALIVATNDQVRVTPHRMASCAGLTERAEVDI